MEAIIYDPLEDYEGKFKALHNENCQKYLDELVAQSGINIEENRKTVNEYNTHKETIAKMKKKLNWLRFFRVLMIITLVLIPIVIWKMTPKIRQMRSEIADADKKADELLSLAKKQMQPLNSLFSDRDGIVLIQQTLPNLKFDSCFTVKQEMDMRINYDFQQNRDNEQSTVETLAGEYNENPFLFESRIMHRMGTETYHGYKTITWTERYRDSNGKMQTRLRTETLHATVTKPKPFYHTQLVLNYCAQGGPDLCFSRDATHLEQKNEREIERYIKKGEKRLQKMAEKALEDNKDFTSMSNSDFEVLFDALNRNNEVQFRTLFTPLAQTNMVSLIRSTVGYGDDFNFIKAKRTNQIVSEHSQNRKLLLFANEYYSHSFDIIKDNFINKNNEFFRAVYFDFAPLWAVPIYQERPVNSLKPIPDYSQLYSYKECEALANALDSSQVVHPDTKTKAILKSAYISTKEKVDETCITAYSYDIIERVDIVRMYGGDGKYHNVSVYWDDYIPLKAENHFFVTETENAQGKSIKAQRNGLCIFN